MSEQKREHFRIIYPLGQAAKIEANFGTYAALDVSQRGVKISVRPIDLSEHWRRGSTVDVKVYFLCGAVHKVSGTVVRIGQDHVALQMTEPFPLKTMYDEHRFLIQKFGQA
jgi:hypothetical protein